MAKKTNTKPGNPETPPGDPSVARSAPQPKSDERPKPGEPAAAKPSLADEVSRESRKIRRWNFATHLLKRRRDGELSLNGGLGGLRHEYAIYRERKQKTEEKYLTYETVVASATDSAEYYVLLVLSCLIATFGLLNNSAAVIIGAMIVAPLMGPILGLSAGVLWGSGRTVLEAVTTLLWGILIVLGITAAISFALPFVQLSEQILARTTPNLLDIGIALASGLAGAYAYTNKKVSASIPGVAIAVALMPPLCTIGITLGIGRWDLAVGAATLFGVNLLGISLAALIVFYLVDLHPHVTADEPDKERIKRRVFSQLIISLAALLAIAIPMIVAAQGFVEQNRMRQLASDYLYTELGRGAVYELSIQHNPDGLAIRAILLGGDVEPDTLQTELAQLSGIPVELHLFRIEPVPARE